jgi:DNA-binding transcriptional LysR family regulator
MDLQKLETFVSVAELGSLSKASLVLTMQPSLVSRHLSAFERECGGRLFNRTGRGMTLTDLGQRVLPRVQAMLVEYRSLIAEVQTQQGVLAGEVRVGLVPSIAHTASPRLFEEARRHYPKVQLQIIEGMSAQLDVSRMAGQLDITVVFRSGNAELHSEDCLGEVDAYLVGPADSPLTATGEVAFSRLAQVPLVLAPRPNALRSDVEDAAKANDVVLDVVLETNSISIQRAVAARGLAHTIMAGHAAAERLELGLRAARIVSPGISRTIALGIAAHRPPSDAVRQVARIVRLSIEDTFKYLWQRRG